MIFLGPISPVILMLFVAYAIVRYGFMDIKPIIARAVSFVFLVALVGAAYAFLLFFVVQELFGIAISTPVFWSAFAVTLAAMFGFRPLERFLQSVTDKIFFKEQYDSGELLAHLTRVMAETIDLEEMTSRILRVLTEEIHISKAAFLVVDAHKIIGMQGVGYHDHEFADPALEGLFHEHFGVAQRVVFEELEEGSTKELFRKLDISIAFPVRVENKEVAILIVGAKASGEMYHAKDLEVLGIFASESGIAIQNAKAYDRIKKFNKELEARVEERTRALKETQKRELAKANQVAQLKDEFVFIAAHELRTPVTAIKGFLELVQDAAKHFPKDAKEHLDAVKLASDHLNQLINDLLEVARSDAGTMKVNVEPIDMVPIIAETIKEMSPIAEKKQVSIHTDIAKKAPLALGDAQRMREVVTNLLGNAVKYNKEKGEIFTAVFTQGDRLIMEFRDTGYGVAKDQQGKMFQKFFRAHTKGTETILGTGLGLFVVRILVEKMGGKISFSSVEGEGTTFAVSLEIAK